MDIARKLTLRRWRFDPGQIEAMVELSIDVEQIAQMLGNKAINNRTRRSTAMHGLVKATVREVKS